jgi:hypothetical protein
MFTLTIEFILLASGNWRLCDIRELDHHHFGGENLGEQCSRYLGHKRIHWSTQTNETHMGLSRNVGYETKYDWGIIEYNLEWNL